MLARVVVVRELDDGVAPLFVDQAELGGHDQAEELVEELRKAGEREDEAVVRSDGTEVVLIFGRRVRIVRDLTRLRGRDVVGVRDEPPRLVLGVVDVERELADVDLHPFENQGLRHQHDARRREEEEPASPLAGSLLVHPLRDRSHGSVEDLSQILCIQLVACEHVVPLSNRVGLWAAPVVLRSQQ